MINYSFIMKKFLLITFALAALSGCAKWVGEHSKDFTHTGCSTDTRGLYTDDPSLLTIKYEDGDLRVTRTNAELNCAFKERGLVCNTRIEGNVIHYDVDYEREEDMVANCICLVEKMTSTVSGLEEGQVYVLQYSDLDFSLKPITFTFKKGLHEIYDVESLYNIVITE